MHDVIGLCALCARRFFFLAGRAVLCEPPFIMMCFTLVSFSLDLGAPEAEHVYKMSHPRRGQFIIINNRKFDARTQMGERTGTDADAANLYARFKELGFDVSIYSNLKAGEMLSVMTEGRSSLSLVPPRGPSVIGPLLGSCQTGSLGLRLLRTGHPEPR